MRYAEIKKNDIVNGRGVCVSFWTQGCPHRCKGCHNPTTWNPDGGKEDTVDNITNEIIRAISARGVVRNFSVLGGEPLAPYNVKEVKTIVDRVREVYPDITIFLWTGYVYEDLNKEQQEALSNVNVVIDGLFNEELKDLTLQLKGSSNQNIIYLR